MAEPPIEPDAAHGRSARAIANLTLAALALGMGCGGSGPGDRTGLRAAPADSAPSPVRVAPVTETRLPRLLSVTGTLASDERAVLAFEVSGRLARISVDLGSRVKKGDPIASLDPIPFRLQVEQAEAALGQARARVGLDPTRDDPNETIDPEHMALVRLAHASLGEAKRAHDRAKALFDKQLVPQSQLDTAEADLKVAEARYQDNLEDVRSRQALIAQRRTELKMARRSLEDSVLTSPLDGGVESRRASVGEVLAAGTPVVSVVRLHPLRLKLAVPEREAPRIHAGQEVFVLVEGDSKKHSGRVVRLSPSIEQQNRTLLVEAEVPNEEGDLRPGAFAKAQIVLEADVPSLLVPATSIVTFAGLERVLVVRDGKTVEKRVQTGRRDGASVEIVGGLAVSDSVVVDPGNLVGGQPVTVAR